MNRRTRALLVTLTAVGVLFAASPANAGSLSWKDDAGDAVGLGLADGPVHDPAFDITEASIATVGAKLVWTATLPEMAPGTPDLSTGYNFRFGFTHGGADYWFQVGENALGEQTISLAPTAAGSTAMECKDCKGAIDREKKAVGVEAPLASLDAAFTALKAPPTAGAEWATLFVIAQRKVGSPATAHGATLTADTADAPEGAVFTF